MKVYKKLFFLVLISLLIFSIKFDKQINQVYDEEKIENSDSQDLKTSGFWQFKSIHIDDSGPNGNGTWASH